MSTLTKLALGIMARQTLHELPQIHAHHSTDAAFDLIAEIEVANLAELDRLLSSVRTVGCNNLCAVDCASLDMTGANRQLEEQAGKETEKLASQLIARRVSARCRGPGSQAGEEFLGLQGFEMGRRRRRAVFGSASG